MDMQELHDIAKHHGLIHAEFCLEQWTTQAGQEAAEPLWDELAMMFEEKWLDDMNSREFWGWNP